MKNIKKTESTLENKFAHEEDMRFRAVMRRTRLLAGWAAARMGVEGAAYGDELANLYLATPDDDAMAAKVRQDLAKVGVECADYDIRVKMVEFLFADAPTAVAA